MLLLCAVVGAEDLMGTLRERLREKYSNSADKNDEMRAFYESCEAVTTTLVCDWIRNEAENGDLEPLEHFNNILGVDNHYESGFEAELGMSPDTSIQYPFCSWRYMYSQLSRDSSAWNVAFPDQNSIYHAMLVYFNKDDEFVIKGPNIPYVRYFSLQTYDPSAASIDSKIDYQLRTEYNSGSNAYSNATCGEAGDPQGSFDIRITAHGNKYQSNGFINELAALHKDRKAGFFFLFLRLYDPEPYPEDGESWNKKMAPMINECYGVEGYGANLEEAKRWGWVCPPILKRTNAGSGIMTELPYCVKGRDDQFKNYNQGATPGRLCLLRPNSKNNLFLPANSNMHGMFRNKDANYLMGCALHDEGIGRIRGKRDGKLWARLSGKLPKTPNSLYDTPYVGDPLEYDIRYISISSINRSPPSAVMMTLKDDEILSHLRSLGGDAERNREYVIWFGPDESEMPQVAKDEGGIFVPWPREYQEDDKGNVSFGDLVPYPGILYREILSQSQVLDDYEVTYEEGITDIIRNHCFGEAKQEREATWRRNLRPYCYEETCCGDSPPECCRERRHIHETMRGHYPKVDYYFVSDEAGEVREATESGGLMLAGG